MAYENKVLRLIAGVKSRKQMEHLLKYFKEKEINVPREYISTALNKYYMLPDEEGDLTS